MRSLWWNMLVQPQICFMCGGGGDPGGGGDDDDSGSTTTTTTTTTNNTVGTIKQDENGNWYEVVEIEGTNAKGRNYGVDTSDNSAGPDLSQAVHSGGDDDNDATSVTVESGDTLSEIAESLDTSVGELMAANPNITNPNEIVVGQTINTTGVQTGVDTYEGMSADDFMTVSSDDDIMAEYDEYMAKLEAAGEADTSTLDEIAAADTTGIDVYEPTEDTAAAVTEYYTEGAGAPGATQTVDFTETSSGEDFTAAAESDTADVVGGTNYTTYFGETVEVRELPSGTKYYVDLSGNYVALAPEEDVTVDTFSDSETTTPVSELYGYEDTILETGTGGISGIRLGDPMTPQLAAELGLSDIYQEGDVILAEDLIKLDQLGFDVSQADLSGIDLKTGADAGTLTVTTADGATATTADTDVGMTTKDDAIAELKRRVNEGIYTADVSVDELTATLALLEGRELTDNEIAALMPDYQFVKPDPGTQILLGEASPALGQEQLGALSLAIADGMSKLGIDYDIETLDTLGQNLADYGLSQIEAGQANQDVAFEKLKQFDPEASEAFNQPIIDPETGEFNATALYTKGLYSSVPTIAGLSGLLVGLVPGAVTGAVMTAAELGSESFNKVYKEAKDQNLSDADALALARTANATAAALGAPIGAVSNMLLGTLSSGIGTGSIANKIASAGATMLAGAVDEGLVEQSTIASVVDTQLGNEGNIYTTPNGEAFSWNVSMDEGILGALTGGLVSLSAYTAAKAAGATDAQIAKAVENTPAGQTVDLTNTVFDASSEVTPFTTASEILQSGDNVTIGTDADGNITLVNNDTGESSVLSGSEVIAGSALTGSETTVGGLQAVEDSTIGGQGPGVTIDSVGNNIVVTNNDTGFSAVVGVKDNVNIVDVTNAVQNNDATAVTTSGASVNTAGTGGITTIAGASAATGAVGANAATAATANIGSTTTTAGNSDVTTVGDVTVTTTVDAAGNTIVSTTNNTTGATTADIISAGTTGVVTNGTVEVAVDATTSDVTTTAVDTATDVATDAVTDVTSDVVTDAVTDTVTDTVVVEPPVDTTPDVITTPPDEFTPTPTDDDEPPLGETDPGYTSGIAGLGGGVRPVVSPYYQPQQTGQYSFYVPQPRVAQTPAQPVFTQPTSYLAPTAQPQYGYGYIAPNTDIEYLRRLAEIQGTGAEKLPSEDLMDGS